MCFKKWFGNEEEVVEEVVEEVPVEMKPVEELDQMMKDLMAQLKAVIDENKKLEERIKQLEEEKQQEYEATCKAKDQVVELLNEKAEMERLFNEIEKMAKR